MGRSDKCCLQCQLCVTSQPAPSLWGHWGWRTHKHLTHSSGTWTHHPQETSSPPEQRHSLLLPSPRSVSMDRGWDNNQFWVQTMWFKYPASLMIVSILKLNFRVYILKNGWPCLDCSVGWNIISYTNSLQVRFPGRPPTCAVGLIPYQGVYGRQSINVSLSHQCLSFSLSPPLSLKSIKHILGWGLNKRRNGWISSPRVKQSPDRCWRAETWSCKSWRELPAQMLSAAKFGQNPWAFGNQVSRRTINILLRKLKRLRQDMCLYWLHPHHFMESSKWRVPGWGEDLPEFYVGEQVLPHRAWPQNHLEMWKRRQPVNSPVQRFWPRKSRVGQRHLYFWRAPPGDSDLNPRLIDKPEFKVIFFEGQGNNILCTFKYSFDKHVLIWLH